ncbi:MAG TPA: DUF1592 domain-containing protein [Polyangiaceae bacterium]|nr:DUF1592 domain-containing protein [Polyangiaceae bacterium]
MKQWRSLWRVPYVAWGVSFLSVGCAPAQNGGTGSLGGEVGASGNAGRGSVGGSSGGSDQGSSGGGSGGGFTVPSPGLGKGPSVIGSCGATGANSVGATPLRRISALEYQNAVHDLFGDTENSTQASGFPSDEKVGSFISNSKTTLSPTNNEGYLSAAEGVSGRYVGKFAAASKCASSDTTCAQEYLLALARRAFHGTLEPAAASSLRNLYTRVASKLDGNAAVEAVVRSILLSPQFLFIIEYGTPDGNVSKLTESEVAGRLAAFLWRSVPDAPLLALADAHGLDTSEKIMAQAESMLADARGNQVADDFVLQWLQIDAISRISRDDSAWTPALRDAMMKETELTFEGALKDAAVTYTGLLTSSTSYVNNDLAQLYGMSNPSIPFEKSALPDNRRGILAQASFLATLSHPQHPSQVLRGKAVREQLLCDFIAPPPPGVERNVGVTSGQSSGSAIDAHTKVEPCATCHLQMDPIGRGFARYNQIGRYAETDNGQAVSGEGEIFKGTSSNVTGKFAGVAELATLISNAEFAQQCFAIQAMRFALGRNEQDADACSAKGVWDKFVAGKLGVRQLFVSLTGMPAFSQRNTVKAGMACR